MQFQSENTAQVVEQLKESWEIFASGKPFEYNFLDEAFGNMYASEKRLE